MAGLVERQPQLDVLETALHEAAAGTGSTLLITGEAGIGKTSLVRAFLSSLPTSARVLSGSCEDLLSPRALGALRDAAAVVPGPLADSMAAKGDAEEVFGAVLAELQREPSPTVLAIEDVHWADSATLDVVRYVARRIDQLPALLVLTYREVPIDHPLRNVVGSLASRSARRIPLDRLSPAGVAALVGDSPVDVDSLVELTDGNPFFVTEVLAAPEEVVPPTVADAVAARVGKLGRATRAALAPLAVVPQGLELPALDALAGGLDWLEEAEGAGVLEVAERVVRFRHELARRAVEESMTTSARNAWHRKVLELFERRGDVDPSQLLHHAVCADDGEAIVRWGVDAAREATRVAAHRQAVACYEQVLRRRHLLAPEQVGRHYEVYSWALSHANRFGQAAAAAEAAVQNWREVGDPAHLVRPLVALTRQQWITGRCGEALETAAEALDIARVDGEEAQLALALVCRGGVLVLTDRETEALPVLEEGLALAERLGETDTAALTRNYLGSAHLQLGRAEGEQQLRQSVALARGTANHEYVMRGYYNLAEGVWRLGDYDRALGYVTEGENYGRDRDFPAHEYFFRARRHRLQAMRGQWREAEAGLRTQLEGPEDPGMIGRETVPVLARLLVRRGEAEALTWLERSAAWARRTEVLEWVGPTGLAWLEHAWLSQTPSLAEPWSDALLAATDREGCDLLRAEVVRYLRRLGRHVDSSEAEPAAFAAASAGDWAGAAELWEQAGDPYHQALELLESGQRGATTRALELLNELGAAPAARIARRRLRALGVSHIPRRTARRGNPARLTDRQVEILQLVAEGLTNPEIAERLVISPRTVDHHVSAALRQLGVENRRQAAQVLSSWDQDGP